MSIKVEIPNLTDLIRRYESGASLKQLSDETGFGRQVMLRRFVAAGVQMRGQSDAERLKWRSLKRDPARVRAQCESAWIARRGQRDPLHVKIARARTMQDRLTRRGLYEDDLAAMLGSRGFPAVQQHAVGPYNVDLLVRSCGIAVEVQSSHHRGRQSSIDRKRLEYILDAGWALVVVYIPLHAKPRLDAIADYLVALFKKAGRGPSLAGQYGVIGREGQPMTPRRFNLPDRPRIAGA